MLCTCIYTPTRQGGRRSPPYTLHSQPDQLTSNGESPALAGSCTRVCMLVSWGHIRAKSEISDRLALPLTTLNCYTICKARQNSLLHREIELRLTDLRCVGRRRCRRVLLRIRWPRHCTRFCSLRHSLIQCVANTLSQYCRRFRSTVYIVNLHHNYSSFSNS